MALNWPPDTGREWDSREPQNRKKGTLVCTNQVIQVPKERGGSQTFSRGRKETSAVSRAALMLKRVPLLLLLQGFFDPGQVVGDAGVDSGQGVVPKGNNALCHLIAYQGPARISLRTDKRLVLEASSLWEQVSPWSLPARALTAGLCLCSGSAALLRPKRLAMLEELSGAGELGLYPCDCTWIVVSGMWKASPHGSYKSNTCHLSWEPAKSVPAEAPATREPACPAAKPPAHQQPIPGWNP